MKKRRFQRIKADAALKASLFLCIGVVVVSQVGLRISSTRALFTNAQTYEGQALGEENDAVKTGKVTLSMPFGTPGNQFEILVNGEKVDVFDLKQKEIELLSTSVIEVRAHDVKEKTVVRIDTLSDNMSLVTPGEEFTISEGVNMLGRILWSKN